MRRHVSGKIAAIIMTAAVMLSGCMMTGYGVYAEEVLTEEIQAEAPQAEENQAEAPQAEEVQAEAPQAEEIQAEAPQAEEIQAEAPQAEEIQAEAPQAEEIQVETPQAEEIQAETPQDKELQETAPQTESAQKETTGTDPEELFTDDITSAKETAETETESYKTSFCYEDSEVVITATVKESAKLPERAQLEVEKLQPGSAGYEAAKQVSMRDLGTTEDAAYAFYDVRFTVDGQEIELADGEAEIRMQFRTVQISGTAAVQSAVYIEETSDGTAVRDVTADTGAGSVLSSVGFTF